MIKFENNKMTLEEAQSILKSQNQDTQANLINQESNTSQEVNELVLDLSIARDRNKALEISFPFHSLRVEEATDSDTQVRMLINTNADFQKNILLKLNDVLNIDNGIRKSYLYWTAQSGKSIIIKFFTTAKVSSGSLVLAQSSNPPILSIGHGSSPMDNTTFHLNFSCSIPTLAVLDFTAYAGIILAINDSSYNNGTLNYFASIINGHFKVPVGYTAELIGAEITSFAIGSTYWVISFVGLLENVAYPNPTAVYNSNNNIAIIQGENSVVVNKKVPLLNSNAIISLFAGFTPNSRTKRIFLENEMIVPFIQNNAGVASGAVEVNVAVKLTKNVGA